MNNKMNILIVASLKKEKKKQILRLTSWKNFSMFIKRWRVKFSENIYQIMTIFGENPLILNLLTTFSN